jgi:gluconolactonase
MSLTRLLSISLVATLLAPLTIVSADVSSVVAEGAIFQPIAGEYRFTEGGTADANGDVYFSDIPENRIYRWNSSNGSVQLVTDKLNRPNGLSFSPSGDLMVCESGARRIVTITANNNIRNSANELNGLRFNSPNDLWLDPFGGVYFTDPRYGKNRDDMEMDGEFVFYFRPGKNRATIVDRNLTRPNGITGTPDGKALYVADPGDNKTYVYQIEPNGGVSNRELFVERGSDGMTLDSRGNVYLTNEDSVWVYTPNGGLVSRLPLPDGARPTNVCFGGPARSTLFVTARNTAFTLAMKVTGAAVN